MQKPNQIIAQLTNNQKMKKYFFITLLGAVLGILVCYFVLVSEFETNTVFSAKTIILSAFSGILIAYLIYATTTFLDRFFPWQTHIESRLLAGLVIHFLISFLLFASLFFLYEKLFEDTLDFSKIEVQMFTKIAIILFILTLMYEIIYFALYSYYSYSTLQIETVKQERKQIELQLKALKSQLSPHFLFNSLNTISSLVFKDEKRAENFIRRLANMYNYTLKSYNTKLISLKEELDFLTSYQYLLQTRFENKIHCNISISEDLLETKIPPLTLQMLVENAVKHNQLRAENPLEIKITSDEKYIAIQNNLTQKPNKVTSFNIGLKNINTRYLLLHKEGIIITNGQNFTVKIPVIR